MKAKPTKEYDLNEFLRVIRDLESSIKDDVLPTLQPNISSGGYFAVPRELLCYVDYLGLLLDGWKGKINKKGKKDDFATAKKAVNFITKYFSRVDETYEKNGELFYSMYRHGTVHLYCPLKLKSPSQENKTIEWLVYKGEREAWLYVENKATKVRHMEITKATEDRYLLPISIITLYNDIFSAINIYKQDVLKDNKLLENFVKVAKAIDETHDKAPCEFVND